ncbi:MAG: hypothetical protein IH963_02430 [Chloroflexi bacterium]|nr:hypothetical protein [Chloroflexota bacterium]
MLSWFRKPKANMSVEISGSPFSLGSVIHARVSINPMAAIDVRKGTMQLVCRERFWKAEITTSGGNGTVKHTDSIHREVQAFLNGDTIAPGTSNYEMTFQIPPSGHPTIQGELASVTWSIEATLEVAGTRNLEWQQDVEVLTLSENGADVNREAGPVTAVESTLDECSLTLTMPSAPFRAGDTIQGIFSCLASRAFDSSTVRVQLERRERAGDKGKTVVGDQVNLEEKFQIPAGGTQEWPFRLSVPRNIVPTKSRGATQVAWRVKGIIDRGRKGDLLVESPIEVFTAP